MAIAKRVRRVKKLKPYHKIIHDEFPILAKGSNNPDELAAAVGYALTQWELIDEFLAMLFGALVQSKGSSAEAAYGMITGFGQRCGMIRAAARRSLPSSSPLLAELQAVLADLESLSSKRNNIAHGIMTRQMTGGTGKKRPRNKSFGYFLTPPRYNTKKALTTEQLAKLVTSSARLAGHQMQAYAYTAMQVRKIQRVFVVYRNRTLSLYRAVAAEMYGIKKAP